MTGQLNLATFAASDSLKRMVSDLKPYFPTSRREVNKMKKPHWLSNSVFEELLEKYNRIPRCVVTGKTEADGIRLSVDHIKPRYQGGTDEVSNLQFMEIGLNCRKGASDDMFWGREFWFDTKPNMEFARTAQKDAFNEILRCANWFAQPMSAISRLLYIFPWIVGAGKTLNILTSSCALNAVMRQALGSVRRANRILVLAKEQAIRDQLDKDLREDSVKYKLFQKAPKVEVVESSWRFRDGNLDQADVVVACIQQLFEMDDRELAALLHEFPLIWIDEPHWAVQQVLRIIAAATTSICLGNTGSPIDNAGELLQLMVAVNIFGYQDADEGDRSVKFLDTTDVGRFVRELDIQSADTLHGPIATVSDDDGYEKNIEPAKAIVDAVIAETKSRDNLSLANENMAEHREGIGAELGILYPNHPMIVCDHVAFGEFLCRHANRVFEQNRDLFPREQGYHAEIVHAEGEDRDGLKRNHKPLDPEKHPWLRYKNKGVLDAKCSRFLFVSGMGREGVNNPFCGPIGSVSVRRSLIEDVQRGLGRQIRSVVKTSETGNLIVPPGALDSVLVITHKAFDKKESIVAAIDWIMNMHEKLEGLPTVQSLMDGDQLDRPSKAEDDILLPTKTKIAIAGIIGGDRPDIEGWPDEGGSDDDIIKVFGGDNSKRRERIVDWIDIVRNKPAKARKRLGLDRPLATNVAVIREEFKRQPTDDDLRAYLRVHHSELASCDFAVGVQRDFAMKMYLEYMSKFKTTIESDRDVDQIKKNIQGRVFQHLGRHYKENPAKKTTNPFNLVGRAVKDILGTEEKVKIGSRFDIPQVHTLLMNPEIERKIVIWVCGRLIDAGHCPALDMLKGKDDESLFDEDAA